MDHKRGTAMGTIKNSVDITNALAEKKERGGAVFLPVGEYTVETPVLMETPSTRIQGEVWAYNLDPNGVFETRFGTKLRLKGRAHPAISIGAKDFYAPVPVRQCSRCSSTVSHARRFWMRKSTPRSIPI